MIWLLRNILFYFILVIVFQISCNNYLNNDRVWFTHYVYWYSGIILFLVLFFKWKNKWTGIRTLNSKAAKYEFVFNKPLQSPFIYWTKFNHVTEIIVSFAFGLLILYFDLDAWYISVMLLINGVENVFFLFLSLKNNKFRLAVNEFAVVNNARGTYILPFHNLKSIERKYEEFFFIYNNGDTLTIPLNALSENDLTEFRQLLDVQARKMEIFLSDRL
jgi:hypothetical protein